MNTSNSPCERLLKECNLLLTHIKDDSLITNRLAYYGQTTGSINNIPFGLIPSVLLEERDLRPEWEFLRGVSFALACTSDMTLRLCLPDETLAIL